MGHCEKCIEHLDADRTERFVTEWLWGLHTVWLDCLAATLGVQTTQVKNSEVLHELKMTDGEGLQVQVSLRTVRQHIHTGMCLEKLRKKLRAD